MPFDSQFEAPVVEAKRDPDGILVVNKEKEWTSHDVCAFLRGRFKFQKVGHAGTLDPMATGVLVMLIGKATKMSQTLAASDKDYEGSIRLGLKTDSYDITGKVLEERDWQNVEKEQILKECARFVGPMEQIPPMVSAVRHQGRRLYKIARSGAVVDRAARPVEVYAFRVDAFRLPEIDFFASVSKGTYLRTLVNDLGETLGCFAALSQLKRVRSGKFHLDAAISIPELKNCSREDLLKRIQRPFPAL